MTASRVRLPIPKKPTRAELFVPRADEIEPLVTRESADRPCSPRFRRRGAALLLPRSGILANASLWYQRQRPQSARRGPQVSRLPPIVLETVRNARRTSMTSRRRPT